MPAYAPEPLSRPRCEHGCDYGRARHILVKKGSRFLLSRPGHKVWTGTGMAWQYTPSAVGLWDEQERIKSHWYNGTELFEGRLTLEALAPHAAAIFAFFDEPAGFDLAWIRPGLTLLLDAPGAPVVPERKPRGPRKPKVVIPERLYRFREDPEDGRGGRIFTYAVETVQGARWTLTTIDPPSHMTRTIHASRDDFTLFAASPEAAVDAYLTQRAAVVKEAEAELARAKRRAAAVRQEFAEIQAEARRVLAAWEDPHAAAEETR